MRHTIPLVLVVSIVPAAPIRAQLTAEAGPRYGRAQGTLATYLAGGYGFGARLRTRRPRAHLGASFDAEVLSFSPQSRVLPYNGRPGGYPVTITTSSRVVLLGGGPELTLLSGRFGAALSAGAGAAMFSNAGAIDGLGDPDRFRRANTYSRLTWMARAGAGVHVRLGRTAGSTRLELSGMLVQAGPAPFLREGNLPIGVISGVYLYPTPIRPSFVVFALGVSSGV